VGSRRRGRLTRNGSLRRILRGGLTLAVTLFDGELDAFGVRGGIGIRRISLLRKLNQSGRTLVVGPLEELVSHLQVVAGLLPYFLS